MTTARFDVLRLELKDQAEIDKSRKYDSSLVACSRMSSWAVVMLEHQRIDVDRQRIDGQCADRD